MTAWSDPVGGLRLGLEAAGSAIALTLANRQARPLVVPSCVKAAGVHLDWYTLFLEREQGEVRTIQLMDARERSVIVWATLQPGELLQHRVDVGEWALHGGGQPLAPGSYAVTAAFTVEGYADSWQGHLVAGPVQLIVARL
jgi:hypothetical protein